MQILLHRSPRSRLRVILAYMTVSLSVHATTWSQPTPVQHWNFDETEGFVAADQECGAGTILGSDDGEGQWVDGVHNGALDLGVDGILDNRVAVDLKAVSGGFTVSLWINPGEQILNPGEYQILSTPGDVVGFTIMNFDNGVDRHDRVLLFWDGNLPNLHVGSTTLEPGEWYHVAITSTGLGGEKLYYVDGELEDQILFLPAQGGTQGNHPGNRDGWAAGAGGIGSIGNGARTHDSIIDDFRIFQGALSAEEIRDVMDDVPALSPVISNVFPADGETAHEAADGISFDVAPRADGATVPADGIKLFLNGEDVSAGLSVAGSETAREVLYEGLEEEQAYVARIEVTDNAGGVACTTFSFGTLQNVVPGLLHHFRMDETSGLVALDLASARNGSLVGFEADDDAQWVRGICDNALDFGADATLNNYVEFESRAVSALDDGGFTVAMWIRPGSQILTRGEYQLLSTPSDVVGFTIMNFDNGADRHDRVLLFWDGSLPNLHVGTTTLEPGTWYHVAITSTGIGGDKLYYVNGELEEQVLFLPAQGGTPGFHPGNVDGWSEGLARVGAIGAAARTHDTIYDDVRIYNRALDEDEIAEVRDECDPVICEPLQIANVSPVEGENFHPAGDGLTFDISTPNAGFAIDPEDITLTLNGVDVSGDLVVEGLPTLRQVSFGGLEPERVYTAMISVTDGCSNLERIIRFATFTRCEDDAAEGLVHLWKLDEVSGLSAFDCVGGSIGTLRGFANDDTQWIEGVIDGGLDLADGTLDNGIDASIAGVDAVETGGFTVAMWIRPGEQIRTLGEYQLLATPGDAVGFTIMNFDNGANRHDRVLLFWDGSLPDLHVGTTSLEPGEWYHVAITSTGLGGEKLYYVNGELEEQVLFLPEQGGVEGNHPGTRNGWPAGLARIGDFGGSRNHDTAYDDVRIYDIALDEDDIADLFAAVPHEDGPRFVRGDADGSSQINITDGIFVLNFLFLGGPSPGCMKAADADDSAALNITDGIFILNFLFLGGSAPPAPYPECGPDPSEDAVTCATEPANCR